MIVLMGAIIILIWLIGIKIMRVRSSKKKEIIDKQEIINYQYKMIELSLPLVQPVISNTIKYVHWELDNKIKETIGQIPYTIRWIGNSETAYLETYAYIMLIGTGHSQSNILEFKYTIYKLGKKCLELAEQKLLVQFLCLIEYSRDKYSFLNKYPQIQAIFIKILQYLEEEHTNSDDSTPAHKHKAKVKRKQTLKAKANAADKKDTLNENNSHHSNSLSQQLEYEKELQQIYQSFNKYFQFISLLQSNQYSCTFKLFDSKKIYVVIQKQCYFMIEPSDETNLHPSNKFKNSNKASNSASQQNVPSINQSSNGNFDKKQFLDIFNYQNQVQESNVISVERGSQIRKPSTSKLLDQIGSINTPKFNSTVNNQHFDFLPQFQIQKNQEKIENDQTFIDELLNNVVLQSQTDLGNAPKQVKSKKKHMQDKMKNILHLKEQLKIVRMKIQNKIRLIDEAHQSPKIMNPISQKHQTASNQKIDKQAEKEFKSNIVKDSVINKHSNFLKKQRKTSYNSVRIIPYQPLYKPQEHHQEQPNRKSANPYLQRMERMLSEKAVSRPHSNYKSLLEKEAKSYQRSKSPEPQRVNSKQYKIRSLSPKNVNVNVNVNINENLLNPISYQQIPIPYKQAYRKKPTQYFFPNHKRHLEGKLKFPQYDRSTHKISNPQASFSTLNKGKMIQSNPNK